MQFLRTLPVIESTPLETCFYKKQFLQMQTITTSNIFLFARFHTDTFLYCKLGSNLAASPSYGFNVLVMAPKLSPDQIDNKLVEIRHYVHAHVADLTAQGSASLKAVFGTPRNKKMVDCKIKTSFYKFLWREEDRFTQAQRSHADETFVLLTQHRQISSVDTHAESSSGVASSSGLQRDRSRSPRRRTALHAGAACGAPQSAALIRPRLSTKRKVFIVDDEPPDEADDVVIELPALDASILQEVKKLGRHPLEISLWDERKVTPEERDERALARKIRKHYNKLLPDTVSYLALLKSEYMWINDVAEAQEQLRGYRRRLTKESSARLRELRRRLELVSQVQPHHVLRKEKLENSKVTDWWSAAGISEKTMIPMWCASDENQRSAPRVKISLWEIHYHLSHQLLRDVDAFWNGGSHPVALSGVTMQLYSGFFAAIQI